MKAKIPKMNSGLINIPLERTKVKLNIQKICNHPYYIRDKEVFADEHRQSYIDFVENNKDTIFTVEYDKEFMKRIPNCVCLHEDIKIPKWAFHFNDLIEIK